MKYTIWVVWVGFSPTFALWEVNFKGHGFNLIYFSKNKQLNATLVTFPPIPVLVMFHFQKVKTFTLDLNANQSGENHLVAPGCCGFVFALRCRVMLRPRLRRASPNHFPAVKHKSRLRLLLLQTLHQPTRAALPLHMFKVQQKRVVA